MGKTRKQKTPADSDEAEAPVSTADLLKILSGIAQTLATQSFASNSAPPSSTPHVNRSLQLPKLQAPDELTIPAFRDWKQRWVDYSHSQQLQKLTVEAQHGILRSALHREWTMLWTSQRIPIQDSSSAENILQLLEDYLRRKRNPLLDRQAFHRRDQQQGESVDRYFAALKSLDDACSFEDDIRCSLCDSECDTTCSNANCAQPFALTKQLQEVRIRDRLICGLRDKEMQRKVLAEQYSSVLTLERVLSICVAVENSYTTGATLSATTPAPPQDVNAASKPKSSFKKKKEQHSDKADPNEPCNGCGKTPRHPRAQCPAVDTTCHHCNRKGHYSKVCRSKQEAKAKQKNSPPPPPNPKGNNTVVNAGAQKLLQLETVIGGSSCFINWLPDTGSQIDAISHTDFLKLGPPITSALTPIKVDVVAANNQSLGPVGSFPATIKLNERSYTTTVGVYKYVTKPLLSEDGCKTLGLVPCDWPYHQPPAPPESYAISEGRVVFQKFAPVPPCNLAATRDTILQQHAAAFDDTILRPMNGEPMSIKLVEGAQPCKRYRAYNIPFHWRDKVKEGLDSMINKDIIEPVPVGEAIDWCHPMVVDPKKETQYQDPPPTYPFQEVSTDLFSYAGFEYVVMVDRFSGWICISKCGTSATTSTVIKALRKFMTDFGIPSKLVSDNGPQFSSLEFRNWAKEWNIHHSTSSPHFPQSNGHAEAAVKAVKYLLAKTSPNGDITSEAFQEGLMELRNTPSQHGKSPAQILFGFPTRTKLPLHRSRFADEWKTKSLECDQRAETIREKARTRYDSNAKWLPKLTPGDIVLIQDHKSKRWDLVAEVIEAHHRGRSFLLRTESGRLLRRNRRFLRRFSPPDATQEPETPPKPQLRRSTRKRRAPTRFANSISLSPRSKLVGGHEILHLVIPHLRQEANRYDHAAHQILPTNEGSTLELNADTSRCHASLIPLASSF